ncbi:MAG TPA: HAMP domain-containing sensor histidine kinase, partial [Thermoanaerobaculia bacterium]|nr:HAMP domain-containing sensor histidine kinase [Thermoanaerobaculia bacterium]
GVIDTTMTEGLDRRSADRARAERVLVVAPTGDDASLVTRILSEAGLEVAAFDDLAALVAEIRSGAGAVLITSEAFADDGVAQLQQVLDDQEPWSELPVLLLGHNVDSESEPAVELLGRNAHLVLLERPLGLATFKTAIDAALRSRRRQYEVKRLLETLAEATREIERAHEQADRAKDEFLATLGHELRSPMTAISGWIQMLKMGEIDPAQAADALSMIESSTKVQAHIIEDLMDVSRIIAGKVMIDPEVIELGPVVANVVATFRPSAALEGVQLSSDICNEPLTAWADASRLQQVGWNVVSNAIKFTPRGGSVHVSLERLDRSAVIRVRDTGRGIPGELLPHVFERYRQAEAGEITVGEYRGLGLGLAIVKHLVERHEGKIEAFSEGIGRGSEFVITLPLRSADPR